MLLHRWNGESEGLRWQEWQGGPKGLAKSNYCGSIPPRAVCAWYGWEEGEGQVLYKVGCLAICSCYLAAWETTWYADRTDQHADYLVSSTSLDCSVE